MTLISNFSLQDAFTHRTGTQYHCAVASGYGSVARQWQTLAARGNTLPFQAETWISTCYETIGQSQDATPLLLTVVDRQSGRDVLALPLVMRGSNGRRIIEAVDVGLTDYHAPMIGAEAPMDAVGRRAMRQAIVACLPPADMLRLIRMPVEIAGTTNPLAFVAGASASRQSHNVLHLPHRYEEWYWDLEPPFRKGLENSLRLFRRMPDAMFRRIEDASEALRIHDALKRLQADQISSPTKAGAPAEPQNEAFFDKLVAAGIRDGSVILTALLNGDEVVAALLGIRTGTRYAMVRMASAGGVWKVCSPGRLIIERTLRYLHARGLRSFDFRFGDDADKLRFGVRTLPLVDLHCALSWRGALPIAIGQLRSKIS